MYKNTIFSNHKKNEIELSNTSKPVKKKHHKNDEYISIDIEKKRKHRREEIIEQPFESYPDKLERKILQSSSYQLYTNSVSFILTLSWIALGWGVVAYASLRQDDGGKDLEQHFTNWNWILLAIYFTFDIVTYCDLSNVFQILLVNIIFWVVLSSTSLVFYLVILVLYDNPNLLLDETIDFGGQYTVGEALFGNTLLHVLPYIVLLYHFILKLDVITTATLKGYYLVDWTIYKIVYVFYQLFMAIIIFGIYAAIFNVKEVYGLTIAIGYYVLLGIGAILIGTIIPFIYVCLRGSSIDYQLLTSYMVKKRTRK